MGPTLPRRQSPSRAAEGGTSAGAATDVSDFAALFAEHAPQVARVAMRVLGNDSDVDDVVQDVFAIAMRKQRDLRDREAVRGWLMRITTNRALAVLRWRRVRRALGLYDQHSYEDVAARDISADRRVVLVRLYRALDRMPPRVRVPWALRYIEGERLEEVARLCGCSLAAVKRRITSARRLLKREGLSDE